MALPRIRTSWPGRCYDALAFDAPCSALARLLWPRPWPQPSLLRPGGPACALVLLVTLPCWLFYLLLTHRAPAEPLLCAALAAWLWMALEAWSTRGLHWDGLADLGDASGSGAQGERFWAILARQPPGSVRRFASFAGLAACGSRYAGTSRPGNGYGLWLLLPGAGPAWSGWQPFAPPREPDSLGGLTCAGASHALAGWYALAALLALCGLSPAWPPGMVARARYCAWSVFYSASDWQALARSRGGISGDFLGAGIQWGQLWFLASTV